MNTQVSLSAYTAAYAQTVTHPTANSCPCLQTTEDKTMLNVARPAG